MAGEKTCGSGGAPKVAGATPASAMR
jgi:hypothetical protein